MAKPTRPTATEFVLSLPDLDTAEVIAKGKAAGYKLSRAHVYTIRSNHKRKPKAAPAAAPSAESRLRDALREAILALGVDRARGIFADVEAQIVRAIRGN